MGLIFLYTCSALCAVIYVTAFGIGVQMMLTRRATFSARFKQMRFTGAAAVLFGIGQMLGAVVSIYGITVAIQARNLLYILPFMLIGALIGMGGLRLARMTQVGEYEFDMVEEAQTALTTAFFRAIRTTPADITLDPDTFVSLRPSLGDRPVEAIPADGSPMIVQSSAEVIRDEPDDDEASLD